MFKKLFSLGLAIAMVLCMNISAFATDYKIDLNDYPKDTRERYVASLALEKGISYDEADLLERSEEQPSEITKNLLSHRPPGPPEVVTSYKTVVKTAGYVKDKKKHKVTIGAEVKYKKRYGSGDFVKIERVGGPYLNMPGVSAETFEGGSYNVEKHDRYARISRTGALKYHIKWTLGLSAPINDIATIDGGIGSGYTISTKTKTFAIQIRSSDF